MAQGSSENNSTSAGFAKASSASAGKTLPAAWHGETARMQNSDTMT
jgi:hypothetical protein